jgi:hypothetical protein
LSKFKTFKVKKNYLVALALFVAGTVSAQRSQDFSTKPVYFDFNSISNSSRSVIDTTFYPEFLPGGSWGLASYVNQFGYLFGTNIFGDLAKAQVVMADDILHPNVDHNVVGLGFLIQKSGVGADSSKIKFEVFHLSDSTNMPDSVFSSVELNWADILDQNFTFVTFPTPVSMRANQSYAVGVDFSMLESGDSISIITSQQNQVTLPGLALEKWYNNEWRSTNDSNSWELDVALFAFVIYEDVNASVKNLSNDFKLLQNTPNPFKNSTVISYALGKSLPVTLEVYDATGKLVESRNEGVKPAGNHSFVLDGNSLNQGLYFYVLKAGAYSATKKMTVFK